MEVDKVRLYKLLRLLENELAKPNVLEFVRDTSFNAISLFNHVATTITDIEELYPEVKEESKSNQLT